MDIPACICAKIAVLQYRDVLCHTSCSIFFYNPHIVSPTTVLEVLINTILSIAVQGGVSNRKPFTPPDGVAARCQTPSKPNVRATVLSLKARLRRCGHTITTNKLYASGRPCCWTRLGTALPPDSRRQTYICIAQVDSVGNTDRLTAVSPCSAGFEDSQSAHTGHVSVLYGACM